MWLSVAAADALHLLCRSREQQREIVARLHHPDPACEIRRQQLPAQDAAEGRCLAVTAARGDDRIDGCRDARMVLLAGDAHLEAQVVRATHPDFGKATVKQALKAWRFTPATRGDVAVEDWQTLSVRFTID